MGNNCTTEPALRASYRDTKDGNPLGCLGCQENGLSHPNVDHAEFQTHNNSLIPKGKISINSIEFLKREEISFLRACAGKNVSAIRYYMKKGVNVNLLDEDRTSPLHVAARSGSLQVVEELLNYGAQINMADMAGWTPLHIAAYYRRALIAHLLLKKGANPYHLNRNGDTPWDLVSDKGTEEIFFIHFDRAEIRKMINPNKEKKGPGEENWAMSEMRPFGSFIDPDFKRSIKEDDSNPFLRGVQLQDIIKKNVEQFSQQSNGQSSKRSDPEVHAEESTAVKSLQALKDRRAQYGFEVPKKHKYYLYFKSMKNNQVKHIQNADLLQTLRSEDSEENSLHFSNSHASHELNIPYKLDDPEIVQFNDPFNVLLSQPNLPLNPHKSIIGRNLQIPISSVPVSQNSSMAILPQHGASTIIPNGTFTKQDHNMTHNRSMFILPTVSVNRLIFGLSENSGKGANENHDLGLDQNLFKLDARFKEPVYKMGVELFNYDGIYGLAFLYLFKLLKKNNIKEVAYFLFKEESSMTLKKNPIEVTKLLTDQGIRECQDILKWYAFQFAYDTKDFFECLKNYLTDFILDFDPEKIDWILRGFAIHYYQKSRNVLKPINANGKREEFESVDAIRMLAFATVMLNHEIHYEESSPIEDKEKLENLRRDFHINLSGINDGENFSKAFINKLFDQVKKEKVMRISTTDPLQEKNQKLTFKTPKLTVRVMKQSKKNKSQITDYYLYISGPVCLMAKMVDGVQIPKVAFSILHCKLRNLKGVNIEFTPLSTSTGGIPVGRFRNKCIQVFTKQSYSFNLYNNEDLNKLEKHINSLQQCKGDFQCFSRYVHAQINYSTEFLHTTRILKFYPFLLFIRRIFFPKDNSLEI